MTHPSENLWTSEAVIRATSGVCAEFWSASGVSIDSRTVETGDLFVAIEGPNQDGHKYVQNAFDKGASAALIHRDLPEVQGACVRVKDTLDALNELGKESRRRTDANVVAVTGSVGKTSTKEALKVALAPSGLTHASAASYNNMWGVPLSLARMPAQTQFGVFEVGMNHPGEIAPLVALVEPHVAIVTTVQPVHIEFFDSVDGIADEKAEIFSAFRSRGTAVINADMPHYERVKQHAERYGSTEIIGFGEADVASARLVSSNSDDHGSNVEADILGDTLKYRVALPGRHFVLNSLAVLAAVRALGGNVDAAAQALGSLEPTKGRGTRHRVELNGGTFLLIDESYNANPTSVAAALRVLSDSTPEKGGRRIAVLGDMLELGREAEAYHSGLSEELVGGNIDQVFLCGNHMAALWETLPKSVQGAYAENSDGLIEPIRNELKSGDIVMVKGSLGSQMGKIVQHFLSHGASANSTGGG